MTDAATERVWLVLAHHDYEGFEVVSVHRTEAGAHSECDRLQERMDTAKERRRGYYDMEAKGREPKWPDGVPDCDGLTVSGDYSVSE